MPPPTDTPAPVPRTSLPDNFFTSFRSASASSVTPRPSPAPRPSSARPTPSPDLPAASTPKSSSPPLSSSIRRLPQSCASSVRLNQALLDAASIVKELIENAVDAGATRVEVRLFGRAACERIVVVDDGTGVADMAHLCRAGATSKIGDFADLERVATFGFRGEGMAAVCGVAERVCVETRVQGEGVGRWAEFDAQGRVGKEGRVARKTGTMVEVAGVFCRLPVRLMEAERHSARDIARCLRVVQEYALACSGVRFEMRVGGETKLLTTPRPGCAEEQMAVAVASVLGRNQAGVMVACTKSALLEGYDLVGLVSKSNHGGAGGGGRLSGAWQFVFVNGRPVDMPRVARGVNESYRRFALSSTASPAFVFALTVPAGDFDVNLAPDKRHVMLGREAELVKALQEHLEGVWCPREARVMPANGGGKAESLFQADDDDGRGLTSTDVVAVDPSVKRFFSSKGVSDSALLSRKRGKTAELLGRPAGKRLKSISLADFISQRRERVRADAPPKLRKPSSEGASQMPVPGGSGSPRPASPSGSVDEPDASPVIVIGDVEVEGVVASRRQTVGTVPFSLDAVKKERAARKRRREPETLSQAHEVDILEDDILTSAARAKGFANSSLFDGDALGQSQFLASQEPDAEREKAERELVRVFRQSWFSELKIVGQFNLGFIVCILDGTDLFIVDQHASDEKYNFEDLARNTVIDTQQLVRPMALDLAVEDELLVIDNLPRFKRSGFDIQHRPSKPPTQRLYLRSQPSSKRTMFVIDDLREMIDTLKRSGGGGNSILRPERVRAMFASRACRKSVMIGTALTVPQMTRLVRQLQNLEHPWSCPHGRPTMRHLMDISLLDED